MVTPRKSHSTPATARNGEELRAKEGDQGSLLTGSVTALITEHEALVDVAGSDPVHATQAAGCLLAPAIGDRVLVFVQGEEAHILSVLERRESLVAQLSVPGADHLQIKSGQQIDIAAPDLHLTAKKLTVFAESLTQTGKRCVSSFTRTFENIIDKMVSARTITTTVDTRTSAVRETETLNAGTLVQNIDHVATQTSEISLITAKEDVRLDATRVSVG
ncbi:DUF3540 domain-containing protein [Roseibium polysiphoniae]|uniref:DUF3540 domain-containing protein n=1 Tax=Roseibium polysiphoniae TaxID=2571221 RepID=A0ABR9CCR5_9HYPH|nr:DUF3540 domain-containing protein [Roseibium polysiphoniae]MBD8876711.1 DUF3540 domain-containing protein [Roseibium polysiphoniae]